MDDLCLQGRSSWPSPFLQNLHFQLFFSSSFRFLLTAAILFEISRLKVAHNQYNTSYVKEWHYQPQPYAISYGAAQLQMKFAVEERLTVTHSDCLPWLFIRLWRYCTSSELQKLILLLKSNSTKATMPCVIEHASDVRGWSRGKKIWESWVTW